MSMALAEIAQKTKARKYKWYLEAYEQHCGDMQVEKMLEIGISYGGSAKMWQAYYPGVKYYAIDLKPPAEKHNVQLEHLFLGSQSNQKLLETVVETVVFLDLVIDDGSHKPPDQKATMNALFPIVRPGGWYIVEDLHTSYWPQYKGGYRNGNMIDFLKGLADNLHQSWFTQDARAGGHRQKKRSEVDQIYDGQIRSIHFYDSICFVQKALSH